jgi:hypothetical protein
MFISWRKSNPEVSYIGSDSQDSGYWVQETSRSLSEKEFKDGHTGT